MFAGFQERPQDRISLRGVLQSHTLEMLMQDGLSLPDHFSGDRRLIVNSLLKHRNMAEQNNRSSVALYQPHVRAANRLPNGKLLVIGRWYRPT